MSRFEYDYLKAGAVYTFALDVVKVCEPIEVVYQRDGERKQRR